MICPNCGLDNPSSARFCANCGTTLGAAPPPPNTGYNPGGGSYAQGSQPYNTQQGGVFGGTRMTPARAIGLGCLILVVIFFLFSASCMRACFFPRHHYVRRVF
jgi:hypothetical protein